MSSDQNLKETIVQCKRLQALIWHFIEKVWRHQSSYSQDSILCPSGLVLDQGALSEFHFIM